MCMGVDILLFAMLSTPLFKKPLLLRWLGGWHARFDLIENYCLLGLMNLQDCEVNDANDLKGRIDQSFLYLFSSVSSFLSSIFGGGWWISLSDTRVCYNKVMKLVMIPEATRLGTSYRRIQLLFSRFQIHFASSWCCIYFAFLHDVKLWIPRRVRLWMREGVGDGKKAKSWCE